MLSTSMYREKGDDSDSWREHVAVAAKKKLIGWAPGATVRRGASTVQANEDGRKKNKCMARTDQARERGGEKHI